MNRDKIYLVECDIAGASAFYRQGSRSKISVEMLCQLLNTSFLKICDEFDVIRCQYLEELNEGYNSFSSSLADFRRLKSAALESKYRKMIATTLDDLEHRIPMYFFSYGREMSELRKMSANAALTVGYHSLPRNFKVIEEFIDPRGVTPCE
jgi:hypothetical protein